MSHPFPCSLTILDYYQFFYFLFFGFGPASSWGMDPAHVLRIVRAVWKTYPATCDSESSSSNSSCEIIDASTTAPAPLQQTRRPHLLQLTEHLFHEPSCLYNEGVYHNFIMAFVTFRLSADAITVPDAMERDLLLHRALKTVDSTIRLNFDEQENLFRYRTWSPFWDHGDDALRTLPFPFRPSSYMPCDDFRTAANAVALWILNLLAGADIETSAACRYRTYRDRMLPAFLGKLWDAEAKLFRSSTGKDHYRAVDQAMAYLSLRSLAANCRTDTVQAIAQQAVFSLVEQFRYEPDGEEDASTNQAGTPQFSRVRPYLWPEDIAKEGSSSPPASARQGGPAQRFLWQECWVILALLSARPVVAQLLLTNCHEAYRRVGTGADCHAERSGRNDARMPTLNLSSKAFAPPSFQAPCFTNDTSLFVMTNRFAHALGRCAIVDGYAKPGASVSDQRANSDTSNGCSGRIASTCLCGRLESEYPQFLKSMSHVSAQLAEESELLVASTTHRELGIWPSSETCFGLLATSRDFNLVDEDGRQ